MFMNIINFVHKRIIKYACRDIDELYKDFNISSSGYNKDEVKESIDRYGYNEHKRKFQETFLYCIRRAFINPFSVVLFILGIISLITEVLSSNTYNKNHVTVYIIFFMLFISGIIRLVQELQAKNTADKLIKMVNTNVKTLRSNKWVEIPSSELVIGDMVEVEAGDKVPADIRLVEANNLFVSQAIFSGESSFFEKNNKALTKQLIKLEDFKNIIFKGTTVTGGRGKGIVLALTKDSVYGNIDFEKLHKKYGFSKGANSISWVLIKFMVILLPIVFISNFLTKGNFLEAFLFSFSVAVGLTPELLPMVVNACLSKGSYSMKKKKTIVKNINAMETFGSIDTLCVDKTGTLTGSEIILEYYIDILGNESQKTLDYAYLNSFYNMGVKNSIDVALKKIDDYDFKKDYYKKLREKNKMLDNYPFNHEKKFSSILVENEEENLIIIKGNLDEVINKCSKIEYKKKILPIDNKRIENAHHIVDEMLEDGMKVIAVAYKKTKEKKLLLKEENNYILIGYITFFDAPKESAKSAIEKLKKLSINVKVLTGDQTLVTKSICNRLDINTQNYITGKKLETISKNDLPILVEETSIFSELTPRQKEKIIKILKENGHTVGFLGDGMNDLFAMVQADVGISVENATESIKESADVILLKKDLNVLEEGVLEGRKAFINMSKYIKITASSNFGNIFSIVLASLFLPFFPMTSIQILLLNLLYDVFCLVLPWDNVDEDMTIKPIEWSGKNLSSFMLFFGLISSIFDLISFLFLYFILCPIIIGIDVNFYELSYEKMNYFISLFQTGWFLESIWTQILIIQLLRTKKIPFIQSKPAKIVTITMVLGITLFTVFSQTYLGKIVGLTRMPVSYYLFLIFIVLLYLIIITVAKVVYIKKIKKLI